MTTYKLLTDSPKFGKILDEIRKAAKRQKKQIEIIGVDSISFEALVWPRYGGTPERKTYTGPGAEVRIV